MVDDKSLDEALELLAGINDTLPNDAPSPSLVTSWGNPSPAEPSHQRVERAAHVQPPHVIPDPSAPPHTMPSLYFVKPRRRSGRTPALYRAEVEAIRADKRTIAEIARAYGVSIMTIRRAKGTGRFAHEEYVPADEYEREMDRSDVLGESTKGGRPLRRGSTLTETEIQFILSSNWTLVELAAHFRISVSTVSRIRANFRQWWPEGTSLEATIRADTRTHHDIARQYDLPVEMIADIKNGLNIVSSGPNIPPPPPGSAPLVKPITPSDDET